ncbi:MAG: outer membrane protein assembly factor BamE [Burkholderiales bacterium]
MKSTVRNARRASPILAAAAGLMLVACISPYRIEIQQGNYISRDAMSQVKPGMTKEQVRAIIGTPLINDIFHADRWDYIFTRSAVNRTNVESRKATLLFNGDILKSVEADLMPPEPSKIVPESAAQKN